MPTLIFNRCGQIQDTTRCTTSQTSHTLDLNGSDDSREEQTNQVGRRGKETAKSGQSPSRITQVDMTDEEIISLALEVWETSSPDTALSFQNVADDVARDEDLRDFLSGIDWSTSYESKNN